MWDTGTDLSDIVEWL